MNAVFLDQKEMLISQKHVFLNEAEWTHSITSVYCIEQHFYVALQSQEMYNTSKGKKAKKIQRPIKIIRVDEAFESFSSSVKLWKCFQK